MKACCLAFCEKFGCSNEVAKDGKRIVTRCAWICFITWVSGSLTRWPRPGTGAKGVVNTASGKLDLRSMTFSPQGRYWRAGSSSLKRAAGVYANFSAASCTVGRPSMGRQLGAKAQITEQPAAGAGVDVQDNRHRNVGVIGYERVDHR